MKPTSRTYNVKLLCMGCILLFAAVFVLYLFVRTNGDKAYQPGLFAASFGKAAFEFVVNELAAGGSQ